MGKYRLNSLGDIEFEKMMQSLLKRVIGAGTLTFGAGPDGAREATFNGVAAYPSTVDRWSGNWVFQVKFHDTELVGVGKARVAIISDTAKELERLINKYKKKVDNYIMITNVPLSGVHERGTLDRIEAEVFNVYRSQIPNLAIWGADDIERFLDIYPEVRRPYLNLLITGDIIAEMLTQMDDHKSERATTIDLYLRAAFSREENAQLDQAGDANDKPIPLPSVFIDLDAYIQYVTREAVERYNGDLQSNRQLPIGKDRRVAMVRYLVGTSAPDRVVIVGGPGEGKSTIGQYLMQIHRATLLKKTEEVALSSDYVPETPRLPFRIVLQALAQWLAEHHSTDSSDSGNLDSYLSEQIARLSARPFTERDLHNALSANPAILVLDGLDEVTDAATRKRLLLRISEFLDKCQNGLQCDLQVVATTRPTNYNDQFDPKTFLHFQLHRLQPNSVREYVGKWVTARRLDEEKASRLRSTIENCLADDQIRFLMTTPLQVTILILIINSGGTPPRQREALFNDYLEVIYKREKGKGLGIIRTEKELLIGLHKFVGYLLHEEVTSAKNSSARFNRRTYEKVVEGYLRKHDPYSAPEHIRVELRAITVDAGERLVLLVESPADMFGFELRSIQEFFAACYLSDTARDTDQRFRRFQHIARLPHWRNVTLFMAGRVGRSNPGEAANIIEVCREFDRSGPDLFVKRGAEVALELAVERAIGPNRVLQRSLLEHGLEFFNSPLSYRSLRFNIELVRRLPSEDIRDHVLPVIRQRLPNLAHGAIVNACHLLSAVAPTSDVLRTYLLRLAVEAGKEFSDDILNILVDSEVPRDLRVEVVRSLSEAGVSSWLIGSSLASSEWPTLCLIAEDFESSDVDVDIRKAFLSSALKQVCLSGHSDAEDVADARIDSPFAIYLNTAKVMARFMQNRAYGSLPIATAGRSLSARERIARDIAERVASGDIEEYSDMGSENWMLWLAHLTLGKPTRDSWSRFVTWLNIHGLDETSELVWTYLTGRSWPIASVISDDWDYGSLEELTDAAVIFGGVEGLRRWIEVVTATRRALSVLRIVEFRKLVKYGPGYLPEELCTQIMTVLDVHIAPFLQPVALEFLWERDTDIRLSVEELDRVLRWFNLLPVSNPWRRRSLAGRIMDQAVRLGRIRSSLNDVCFEILPAYTIARIAIYTATREQCEYADLQHLLLHIDISGDEWYELVRSGVDLPHVQRRRALIRLLESTRDVDPKVGRAACMAIMTICYMVGLHDTRRSAIRNATMDECQRRLLNSVDPLERGAGIALFSVRAPRSAPELRRLGELLRNATTTEVEYHWIWVLPKAAVLANNPVPWISMITDVLQQDVGKQLGAILVDVLRTLLPRLSQSLAQVIKALDLPVIEALDTFG